MPNYYIHKQNLLTTTFARLGRTSAGVSSIMTNEQTPQSLFVYQQHPLGVGAKKPPTTETLLGLAKVVSVTEIGIKHFEAAQVF